MLYLLWALLNIGLLIFFIAICFKAAKLVRKEVGILATIVFVFGLLSFAGISPNSNEVKSWTFNPQGNLPNNSISYTPPIVLEKTLICNYDLKIAYRQDKNTNLNVPFKAFSSREGFICGTNWRPFSIIVNKTKDNSKFEYQVGGIIEWSLLGFTIYSQTKWYKGFATIF